MGNPKPAPTPTWIPGDDDYWRDGFSNRPVGNDAIFDEVGNDETFDVEDGKQPLPEEKKHDDEQKR